MKKLRLEKLSDLLSLTQLASSRARIPKKQSGIDCIIGAYLFIYLFFILGHMTLEYFSVKSGSVFPHPCLGLDHVTLLGQDHETEVTVCQFKSRP